MLGSTKINIRIIIIIDEGELITFVIINKIVMEISSLNRELSCLNKNFDKSYYYFFFLITQNLITHSISKTHFSPVPPFSITIPQTFLQSVKERYVTSSSSTR